jgi:hypothetical protein
MQVSCLAYSSTPKMDATYSSDISIDFQWTTCHYIPENTTLQFSHCLKNDDNLCFRNNYDVKLATGDMSKAWAIVTGLQNIIFWAYQYIMI